VAWGSHTIVDAVDQFFRYQPVMGVHVDILKQAEKAAERNLEKDVVNRIEITPFTNSDGNDSLRVLIVFEDASVDSVTGDQLLDLLLQLKQDFAEEGENRLPILEFATVSDLAEDGDPES
jgi:hypothetical protein